MYSIAKQIEQIRKIGNNATEDQSVLTVLINASDNAGAKLSNANKVMLNMSFNYDKILLADLVNEKIQSTSKSIVEKLSLIEEFVQRDQKLAIDGCLDEDSDPFPSKEEAALVETEIVKLQNQLNMYVEELTKLASK